MLSPKQACASLGGTNWPQAVISSATIPNSRLLTGPPILQNLPSNRALYGLMRTAKQSDAHIDILLGRRSGSNTPRIQPIRIS